MLLFLGCGVVGFLDDFIKVYTQNNQGLSSRAKMAGQTLIALVFGILATQLFANDHGVRPASQYLSTTHDWGIKLPLVVVLLVIWFIVAATSNGANLTDGADGLLAGSSALIFGAYTIVNVWQNNQLCDSSRPTVIESQCYDVRDPLDLAVFSAAIAAACVGFLWWNAKPARIIMGDVGSLAIGGALAGLAIMSRTELLMAVIAGLFVLETLSVLLQMTTFKLTRRLTGTGRRIFRITPIHHHFEHLGWDEVTVVIRFWIIAGLCVAAGLGIFYASWLA
jgi:phospho-N-acetylmuramoyl-pentapeptide-transferase